jgi:predicted permease
MSRWLSGLRVVLQSLVRRSRTEDELDEEIRFHLERQIAEGLKKGLTPKEARYAALRTMGAIDKSKDESRDVRGVTMVSDFLGDLRYAGRALRRSPGFALLAVVIMALGIGANTAVFSVVNAVLLKPLPYRGADRIVTLATDLPTGERIALVSLANFRDWRDENSAFEAMATYRGGEFPVSAGTEAEFVRGSIVDSQLFRVFAVEPIVGRTFTPEELLPLSDGGSMLISYGYWQRRFGGDASVLQKTIRIRSQTFAVVGVLPAGFGFPNATDLYLPERTESPSRTSHNSFAVGRLKPEVSLERAQAELTAIASSLAQQYPDSNKGRGVTVTPLHEELVGDVRPTLYLLWGVVGLVLLIACANTATLLLGKATARTREMAVRAALGANRLRILRQLVAESLLLALVAGASGLLLASWGAKVLVALSPFDIVRSAGAGIDGGVLAFTLVVSVVTSVLFGLVPALHASRINLIDAMKQGARTVMSGGVVSTRGLLVVSQVALAVVLLAGAGLLIKSLIALHNVDLGFRADNVLVMKATGIRAIRENNAFFTDVMERIAALPGVVAVGATSTPPGDFSNAASGAYFVDRIPEVRNRATEPQALKTVVAPGTFAALGIPLKTGRDFDSGDIFDRPMVAIVNEALVENAFPGQNPIGRTIFCNLVGSAPLTIVGVVGAARQRNHSMAPASECYLPYRQHAYNNATLNVVIRTTGEPTALAGAVRRVAAEVSPDVPVSFTTMEDMVAGWVEAPRFRALLFGLMAGLAVCLAMAGVYGVMAYSVEQRSNEIGLRMALGASKGSVLRLVLQQGLVLGAIGLAFGLAGAAVATQLLTRVLFDVQPLDIQVFFGVGILVLAVAGLAGYLPARCATAVNPVDVLKA